MTAIQVLMQYRQSEEIEYKDSYINQPTNPKPATLAPSIPSHHQSLNLTFGPTAKSAIPAASKHPKPNKPKLGLGSVKALACPLLITGEHATTGLTEQLVT